MEKDILVIAHFCSDFDSKGNNRFNYIVDLLSKKYSNVELVTSDFSHFKKMKRDGDNIKCNYKITFISEPGYSKNVSLKRFYSHYMLGRNLKNYLETRNKPDIVYCSVPSLDVGKVAADYAKNNNIRFIIDVQDLWPEAFRMVFNIPLVSNILFYPMKRQANYIYETADEIIAVSQTYVNRAAKKNKKCKSGNSVYLGTDLNHFDYLAKCNKLMNKPKDEIWLAYIGTLGHSYDLISVIDALKIVKDKGIKNLKFIIMGDGPLKSKFEKYAEEKGIYVEFTGRLSYEKMVGILTVCDIAVNPIRKGSAGSIINKVGDYAAAGLPVLNTQECVEYRKLIEEYQSGINCNNNDVNDLAIKLLKLYKNYTLRKKMSCNSRKLAEDKFDRNRTYQVIIDLISELIKSDNLGE